MQDSQDDDAALLGNRDGNDAEIEGKPLRRIIQERLLDRLGLSATSLPPSDADALPPAQQDAAAAGELLPRDVTGGNASWAWAAGQMVATAPDLVRWVQALGDGRLLSPEWQRKWLDSFRSTDPAKPSAAQYGLGLARFGPMVGHTGELPGFNTFMGPTPTPA